VAPSLLRYHFWTTEGGDFFGTVSASQSVGAIGSYTWSSAQMVADVQSWLDNSTINFGWLVRGDESGSATAKRFDTRESAIPPGAGYPIHDINSKPDSDGFANRNAYANTYPLNNTHTNSLADTFLASVAVSARRNEGKRVDRYRPRVRADIRWALH